MTLMVEEPPVEHASGFKRMLLEYLEQSGIRTVTAAPAPPPSAAVAAPVSRPVAAPRPATAPPVAVSKPVAKLVAKPVDPTIKSGQKRPLDIKKEEDLFCDDDEFWNSLTEEDLKRIDEAERAAAVPPPAVATVKKEVSVTTVIKTEKTVPLFPVVQPPPAKRVALAPTPPPRMPAVSVKKETVVTVEKRKEVSVPVGSLCSKVAKIQPQSDVKTPIKTEPAVAPSTSVDEEDDDWI